MKLVFLVENNQPHVSGGGYYAVMKFAEFLAKIGHDVLIYSVYDLGWVSPTEKIKIIYRPKISRKNKITRKIDMLLENLCDSLLLMPAVKQFKPDWVFGILRESAIKAVRVGDQADALVANFIYECPPWLREIYGEETYLREKNSYIQNLWEKTRNAYLESAVLFPNSDLSAEYNGRWLNSSKNIGSPIFPGIDHDQMPFDGPAYHSENPMVVFIGRLVKEKNVHHLIEAWHSMPKNIDLHIIGSGPSKDEYQKQADGLLNVIFHGFVSDEKLWELLRGATLLICPSQFEGFGMPPMQALYFKKPCLVSDLAIFHSIYGDHVDYFPIGDIGAIRKGVLKLVNDKEYCLEKGQAGHQYVKKQFSWQMAAETIEKDLLLFPQDSASE